MASSTCHVLVVDDDELASYALTEYLKTSGYTVSKANDCQQAEGVLHNPKKVDLIILDYLMSDGNGTDLLRDMVEQANLQKPPVIIASSIVEPEDPNWRALCKRLPPAAQSLIRGYIRKPYTFEDMDSLIGKTLTA